MRQCRTSDDLSDEAFSAWANTMGDLMPEGTSERDRAARAWYEPRAGRALSAWGPHAFPDEDLKRLWDILESFQLDAWGYRREIEAEMERREKGE
jgi:hypothetical protein